MQTGIQFEHPTRRTFSEWVPIFMGTVGGVRTPGQLKTFAHSCEGRNLEMTSEIPSCDGMSEPKQKTNPTPRIILHTSFMHDAEPSTKETVPTDATSLAGRLKQSVDRVSSFADRHREPARQDETDKPWFSMSVTDSKTLLTHIQRAEYTIRCMILMLVARWLASKTLTADALTPRQASPRTEKTYLEQLEDRHFKAQDEDKLTYSAFWVTTPFITGKRRGRRSRVKPLRKFGIELVDAKHLLARVKRLSRVVMRMEDMARTLAVRAMYLSSADNADACHPVRSAAWNDALQTRDLVQEGPVLAKRDVAPHCTRDDKPPHTLFFQPLTNWLPPAELYNSGDEQERSDLSFVHYTATKELSEFGYTHDPPSEALPQINIPPPHEPRVCLL